jgi:hypothetical protein
MTAAATRAGADLRSMKKPEKDTRSSATMGMIVVVR